jgi:hypothetical protein
VFDAQDTSAVERLPKPGVGGSTTGGASCGIKLFIIKTKSAALNGFCITRSCTFISRHVP